ncbi:MAG: glycosyltransferase family 2 protein [Calditrichaeota bacterium]|nr:MAG: glycosyltransferase family 2 protein [Calditrichota bacterium]MBL1206353.1 glycosyltransferase family 2 protein [Calditrichota bacterium]NOG46179.1 glycosyltransferase family 2 protein [Calditrichota bacterium]
MELIFWTLLVLLFYIYAGYYAISFILAKLFRKKSNEDASHLPSVTLVISAYNEESVIKDKLTNSLEIDYPEDHFSIVVVSDASDDQTDTLVTDFNHPNIHLMRMDERLGKTFGINKIMPNVKSEIVVFSDANAIYKPDAIKELVKYFNDPKIGYVVGNAQYIKDGQSKAGKQEDSYWSMEIRLKTYESEIGSVVGGDGAIYAIRKELYKPLEADDINDFVNPIQIILQGFRGVFNPKAICYEHSADTFDKEIGRKRRIVNRSWRGLFKNVSVLNPFKTGVHAWQVFSHKLLRWLGGIFLMAFFIINFMLVNNGFFYEITFYAQIVLYLFGLIGWLIVDRFKNVPFFITIPYYFMQVNIASLLGIIDNVLGKKYTTWQTIRD